MFETILTILGNFWMFFLSLLELSSEDELEVYTTFWGEVNFLGLFLAGSAFLGLDLGLS